MVWFIPLITMAASALLSAKQAKSAKNAQGKAQAAADKIENDRLALARKSDARAEELYGRYQRTFVPLEDQLIRDATRKVNPDVEAGLAAADVESALATQRGALSRQIGRRGINPADGAVADAEARLALAGGKARAGASTMARRNAVADQRARLAQAVALGRNLPGMAYNYDAQAGSGLSDVYNQRAANLNYQNQLAGQSGSELGIALADALGGVPQIIDGFNSWNNTRRFTRPNLTATLPRAGMAA
jgi:hypothetical protein